jgi:hypothetical protein
MKISFGLFDKSVTLDRHDTMLIWDALHTHIHDQDQKNILLKSELERFKKLEPLFRPKGRR